MHSSSPLFLILFVTFDLSMVTVQAGPCQTCRKLADNFIKVWNVCVKRVCVCVKCVRCVNVVKVSSSDRKMSFIEKTLLCLKSRVLSNICICIHLCSALRFRSGCLKIPDSFQGLERTANKNFGGGNTAWEEEKLAKYARRWGGETWSAWTTSYTVLLQTAGYLPVAFKGCMTSVWLESCINWQLLNMVSHAHASTLLLCNADNESPWSHLNSTDLLAYLFSVCLSHKNFFWTQNATVFFSPTSFNLSTLFLITRFFTLT